MLHGENAEACLVVSQTGGTDAKDQLHYSNLFCVQLQRMRRLRWWLLLGAFLRFYVNMVKTRFDAYLER
jgi:hypothetical protein